MIHTGINPPAGSSSHPEGRHSNTGAELRSPKVSADVVGHGAGVLCPGIFWAGPAFPQAPPSRRPRSGPRRAALDRLRKPFFVTRPHLLRPFRVNSQLLCVPHHPQCSGSSVSSSWELCHVMRVPLVRRSLMFSTVQWHLFGFDMVSPLGLFSFPSHPFLMHRWLISMDGERARRLGCTSPHLPGGPPSKHALHQPPKCAGISATRSSILGGKPHLR